MKKQFSALMETAYRIGCILSCIAALGGIVLVGSFFLNLFGVLNYAPPMNQDAENVVRVDLIDCSRKGWKVLESLTGEQMDSFLDEFGNLKAKRYANDPPEPYGDILVAIYYADGSVDRIGNQMNDYRAADGSYLPTGGWYWFPDGTLDALFQKFTAK